MAADEGHSLMEGMTFTADLDGFFSGASSGTVSLEPKPMAFGNATLEEGQGKMASAPEAAGTTVGGAAAGGLSSMFASGVAAVAGAGAGAMAARKLGGWGSAMEGVAGAGVPTSLRPMKETAGRFLQKAAPWREFLWPMSLPPAREGCTRLTANIFHFQTNYAILFVVQLVVSIVMQPSALVAIGCIVAVWIFFLKKNEDPEWTPSLGGVQLGPMQRWLVLAAVTTVVLLFVAGGTIFNAALMYVVCAFAHGVFHDPSQKAVPTTEPPVPL